ncbi:VPLPA-CTERM sorting domain-containing protein [Sulfitobacter sp. MF3-043]|uniref:VPLPA-CTERM sorting domain-containing protein n=1 Tax=Sulfitobacter sediminivivens TaxID=3252902 RepID=UPI0036D77BF2
MNGGPAEQSTTADAPKKTLTETRNEVELWVNMTTWSNTGSSQVLLKGDRMRSIISALMFLTLIASASHASPVTVTFDSAFNNPPIGNNPITNAEIGVSQGFLYEYSTVYLNGAYIGLHDDGGILSSFIKPVNGLPFTPHSVDVFGYSLLNKTGPGAAPYRNSAELAAWSTSGSAPLPTLTFQGMVNGTTTATQTVGTMAWSTIYFSKAFAAIDSLLVSLNIHPDALQYADYAELGRNRLWCAEWCAEFQIDNLVLTSNVTSPSISPVPLPASALFLIAALMGLGLVKARSRA